MLPSGSPKARAIAPRLADVPETAELALEEPEPSTGLPPALLHDLLHMSASDSPHDPLIAPASGGGPAPTRLGGGGGSPPASGTAPAVGPAAGQQTSPPREGKVKRFIVSMKTAGPAFLQRQLESQPSGLPPKAAAPQGAAQQRPLLHALTESPAVIRQYADKPPALFSFGSVMIGGGLGGRKTREEEDELFLPAPGTANTAPFWLRRGFWLAALVGLLWTLTFVGAGLGYGLQHCCDSANETIPYRVFFFLATLPAVAWASHALAALSVAVVSWAEMWAERQHRKRQAAAATELEQRRLEEKQRQEEQQQRDREAEKLRRLQLAAATGKPAAAACLRQRKGGSGPKLESMMSWQAEMLAKIDKEEEAPTSGRRSPAAVGGPRERVLAHTGSGGSSEAPPLSSRSAGEMSDRADSTLLPPSPGAAGGGGGGEGPGTPGRPGARGGAKDAGAEAASGVGGGGGIWGLVSSLDLSYLADHVQSQLRHCFAAGLLTGLWAVFWDIEWRYPASPPRDNRFWIFFRLLLCVLLFLVMLLVSRMLSSLAGIKLKRLNHRQRMMDISKREALLQLLLSRGLEDDDDPEVVKQHLLPPELLGQLRVAQAEQAAAVAAAAAAAAGGAGTDGKTDGEEVLLRLASDQPPTLTWRQRLARLGRALPRRLHSGGRSLSEELEAGDIEKASDEVLRRAKSDAGPQLHPSSGGPAAAGTPRATGLRGTLGTLSTLATRSPLRGTLGGRTLSSPRSFGSISSRGLGAEVQGPTSPTAALAAGFSAFLGHYSQQGQVVLTSKAGDLSTAHLLADRERHFLEGELRLKYWKANALAGHVGDRPVLGKEEGTVLRSENDARALGRFVYQKRIMAFLKLRQKLTEEAQADVEAARAAAARRAAEYTAREAAKAAAAREAAAAAAVAAVPPPPQPAGGRTLQRDFSDVAASLGLAELFGSDAEEEEEQATPSPPAVPAAPPQNAAGGGQSGPAAPSSGATPAPPAPAAPPLPSARPPLQLAAAAAASAGAATPGSAPSTARRSARGGQLPSSRRPPRLRGFGKEELKAFLEARGAGQEADYAFETLDRDADGWVTEENAVRMVRQLQKDRANMRASLLGTNRILKKLDWFILGLLLVLWVVCAIAVWGVPLNDSFWTAFSALLLAFSFIFQSTITNIYENVVFIFLVHPFDVGDTLLLSTTSGGAARHDVEEIHLNYTRFLDKDNGRVWWPNRVLRDTPFINLSMSEVMEDSFHLLLDLAQAAQRPELLRAIQDKLDEYCKRHPSEMDTGGTSVTYRDIQSPMGILMKVEWHYSHPGTSKERCAKARTGLLIYTAQLLTELGVRFDWPHSSGSGGSNGAGGLAIQRSSSGGTLGHSSSEGQLGTPGGGGAGGLSHRRSGSLGSLAQQPPSAGPSPRLDSAAGGGLGGSSGSALAGAGAGGLPRQPAPLRSSSLGSSGPGQRQAGLAAMAAAAQARQRAMVQAMGAAPPEGQPEPPPLLPSANL